MRHLFKQLHTEWMSKFLAIYRWHHKRWLLKHSQNKYHAQINFSCPTYIRKQSFQPCFTSQNSSFKQIYDRAAQQHFFFLPVEQSRIWLLLSKNRADFWVQFSLPSHFNILGVKANNLPPTNQKNEVWHQLLMDMAK